jgi:hypothetical protein
MMIAGLEDDDEIPPKGMTGPLVPEWVDEMAVEEDNLVPINPFAIAQSTLDLMCSPAASDNFPPK